jgi:hypothetical protein
MMNKTLPSLLFLAALALGFAGCATVLPPPESIARVPVTRTAGPGADVTAAAIQVIGGRLYAKGSVELTDARPGNTGIRVDVSLLDATGRELAHQSNAVPIHGRTARAHLVSPFWVRLEPWPEGTAQVTVTAHLDP